MTAQAVVIDQLLTCRPECGKLRRAVARNVFQKQALISGVGFISSFTGQ